MICIRRIFNALKSFHNFSISISLIFTVLTSCSSNTHEKSRHSGDSQSYFLHTRTNLQQQKIVVSIVNKSIIELNLESNPKEIEQSTEADIELNIQFDSSRNSIITTTYRNIKFNKKDGDEELTYDAADGANSLDPTTRILGMLKNALITAVISPKGEILSVKGLKELGDSVMSTVNTHDINSRQMLRQQ